MPDLSAYERFDFTHLPWMRPVYRRGDGPAVIVIHEMPGLHPLVVRFADRVAERGMTVYLPSLFGEPGRAVSAGYAAGQMARGICVRREFSVWATNRSSPIVDWCRALAREAHRACGGPGVGVVGMCFTGGFALAMMTEPAVVAPVLSQPSLPLPMGPGAARRRGAIDASAEEIACARQRLADEDLSLLALRFRDDPFVPSERFENLRNTFGERLETIELDPGDALPGSGMAAHSVLTVHLDDSSADTPTRKAESRVIGFFAERLGVV